MIRLGVCTVGTFDRNELANNDIIHDQIRRVEVLKA